MDSESNETFKFLAGIAAKKVEVTEEISSRLRAIAESESTSDSARLLAAQLFFRSGGEFTENDVKNGFLVAGCAEECDAARIAWLMTKSEELPWNPVVIRSLIRGFTKRKAIPELKSLRHVWVELHKIWHRPRLSDSVRWCLQKVYNLLNVAGQSYEETFRFYLVDMQRFVKHRYMALTLLIPAISIEELVNDLEILFYDLKECQKHQHLSSITAECVIAIGKRIPNDQAFVNFLLSVFLSEERQVRLSSLRYWVAQFATEKVFKPTLTQLLDSLRKSEAVKADEDASNLTDIDFFWGLDEREIDCDPWDKDDRRIFAFLVVLQAEMKCFGYKMTPESSDVLLIETYLKHRRSLIRIEALNLVYDLALEEFFLDNAATDDSQLRVAMNKRMKKWSPSEEAVQRVQKWLMVDSNHQRLSFVLDLAEKKDIKLDIGALKALTSHADFDVRRKALALLKREEGFVEFLKLVFVDHLENFAVTTTFTEALLEAGENQVLRENLMSLNQVLQLSVNSKLTSNLDEFLAQCDLTIEENLVLSGSQRLGECSSMAELNCRMEIDKTLLISNECTANIGSYAGVLIECSKTMVDRVMKQPIEIRLRVLKQIWTVLLRSRHKGVVDDCATQFDRLRTTFADEEVSAILEDTLKLFDDENCSSRNLAFWRILLCFPTQVDQLMEHFIGCLSSKSETVVLRALKALKAFLGTSQYSSDCEKFYARILEFILREYSKTSWAVRSAMNHTFEVLVHSLFARIPSNVPLCNFMSDYPGVWNVLTDSVGVLQNAMDPQIVLILSILERVVLVDERIYLHNELSTIETARKRLLELYSSSKQIRVSEQIVDCLLNFTTLKSWYEIEETLVEKVKTKAKRANDHFCVVHAIRRISKEIRHPFKLPLDHYFEERTKLGDYHPLNNLRADFDVFYAMATSSKELNRLCAAYALPYQWEAATMKLHAKRLFIASACLLLDEIPSVRMRACKAHVAVANSDDPVLAPLEILEKCANEITKQAICSQEGLLEEWRRFMAESGDKLKSYNPYFEEFIVVDVILGC